MKTILTAGVLCAALLVAAVSAVHAKSANTGSGENVTPIVLIGE